VLVLVVEIQIVDLHFTIVRLEILNKLPILSLFQSLATNDGIVPTITDLVARAANPDWLGVA